MKLSANVAGLPASVPDETGVDLVAHAGEARANSGHHGVVLASCRGNSAVQGYEFDFSCTRNETVAAILFLPLLLKDESPFS